MMRSADRVVAALYHEEPDKVPLAGGFAQPEARDLFFPQHREEESNILSNNVEWKIKEARWWGNDKITLRGGMSKTSEDTIKIRFMNMYLIGLE